MQRNRSVAGPTRGLFLCELVQELAVCSYGVTVKRRKDGLATSEVPVLVEEHERAGADDRLEELCALSWVQGVWRRQEECLDVLAVGEEYKGRLAGGPIGEARPVATSPPLQVGQWPSPAHERLDR